MDGSKQGRGKNDIFFGLIPIREVGLYALHLPPKTTNYISTIQWVSNPTKSSNVVVAKLKAYLDRKKELAKSGLARKAGARSKAAAGDKPAAKKAAKKTPAKKAAKPAAAKEVEATAAVEEVVAVEATAAVEEVAAPAEDATAES
ncbi:MAG: hypothetical protein KDK97_14715 [Verrucomicrobiales bacterium]|nr:hypothetical protein [Verrucomicrobiales bacterium]